MIPSAVIAQMLTLGFGVSLVITVPIYVVGSAFHIFRNGLMG